MSDTPQITPPPIPAALQKVKVAAGSWSKYMRVLWYGESKSGKSYAIASMPKPILCASGGDEQGVAQYLDPTQGDVCFDITTPDQLLAFIDYGLKNMDFFKSIAFDPITPIWGDYMDAMGEKFGNAQGEIKGGAWKNVKGPWALFMRQLKRSKLHVSFSAWVNDILYEQTEDQPGIMKLNIVAQESPKVEKRIPHHVDIILQTSIIRDAKRRPTSIHEITLMGGRRPRTVSPKDFYVGKKWRFDEKTPTSPWTVIIEPLLAQWQDAAAGAVDFLGIADPIEAETESGETEQMAADLAVGAMLRIIDAATDFRTYRDQTFPKEVAPFINGLKDPAARARVQAAHETKKTALAAGGK
jgi:hypothetical protein